MKRKYPVTPEHIAFRKQLRRENIRASWLRAQHRIITAKCAAIEAAREPVMLVQLTLGLEEKAS